MFNRKLNYFTITIVLYILCISYTYKSGIQLLISENTLFRSSNQVLAKYDEVRNRETYSDLKFSTNTYDAKVISKFPNNFGQINAKENATLLMLTRNFELKEVLKSMRSLEDRFNWRYHYDWTFMNDIPFSFEFQEATTAMASGKTTYVTIPKSDWNRPSSINETRFEESLKKMSEDDVIYGGSKSYRNMCRFNSGYFYKQSVLDSYDYYFRVEPSVEYFCDFPYDPFKLMREKNKKYGFVIATYEYEETIPTLWDTIEKYIDLKSNTTDINMTSNSYDFITDQSIIGKFGLGRKSSCSYNMCHFWSNFEIGDLNFFRSTKYQDFFDYLDASGGFYYERWGDAPVHSIAASLLLETNEIIHFDELGYSHSPFMTCPYSYYMRIAHRCQCDYDNVNNIPLTLSSCLMRWWKNGAGKFFTKEN
ncbi:hypothetical protein TPHA_0B03020 [Tetrapisispora phaffii CBS 4417]|uniref:Mannosyltransferase n=1 Tax=Tetrapisispora phaffii (strain ATCC 24235 / CBS 4417 / NBRC 1672 / NRRL Y-8282 / UCD 70-5) TaxID=1071381 RepID=G8BPP3_TETPH|nr:hypothetical protein TPHA_0B03020 [Tetrapisispora phaffii CBS 4417]CCE61974.1 hypothetical protein TPHA_0B03020 [Tetrapisispora phaffii CBS 4417]